MIPTSDTNELINLSIQSISAIITSLAAVATIIIAYFGLQTWKDQLRGKAEYELAKRLLVHIYQLREEISFVRNPWQVGKEFENAMKENKIEGDRIYNPDIKERTQEAIYGIRWKELSQPLTILLADKLEAEAVWGSDIVDLMNPIFEKVKQLHAAIGEYLNHLHYSVDGQPDLTLAYYSVMSDSSDKNGEDTFSDELTKIIEDIQDYLKSKLRLS